MEEQNNIQSLTEEQFWDEVYKWDGIMQVSEESAERIRQEIVSASRVRQGIETTASP